MPETKVTRKAITIPEAKESLEKIDLEKADQIQKRTLEYVSKFSKTTPDKARALRRALMKECGLTDEEAAELANIAPKTVEEARAFTAGWKKLLPTEAVEKLLKLLRESA